MTVGRWWFKDRKFFLRLVSKAVFSVTEFRLRKYSMSRSMKNILFMVWTIVHLLITLKTLKIPFWYLASANSLPSTLFLFPRDVQEMLFAGSANKWIYSPGRIKNVHIEMCAKSVYLKWPVIYWIGTSWLFFFTKNGRDTGLFIQYFPLNNFCLSGCS